MSSLLAQTLKLFVHLSSNRPVSQEQQCLKKVWDESQKADNQTRGPESQRALIPRALAHSFRSLTLFSGFMHDTLQCALLLSFIAGLESSLFWIDSFCLYLADSFIAHCTRLVNFVELATSTVYTNCIFTKFTNVS